MSNEYVVEAVHRQGMQFDCTVGVHSVTMDYPLKPEETGAGPRPLEMLLASPASCAGGTLAVLLRQAGQALDGLSVWACGCRRGEHPTLFTEIALEFVVRRSVDPSVVKRALELAEERICPVWAMLRPGAVITASSRVEPR